MQFKDVAFSWKETSYVCIQKLGEGGALSVYLVMATSGSFKGKLFAAKFFTKVDRPDWQLSFMKEIHFLRGCSHPAIIRVFDEGMYQDRYPFVVMEYMDGSLDDIYKQNKPVNPVEKIGFIVQILSALNSLSRQDPPGVHRDIKPQNILKQGNNWVLSERGQDGISYLMAAKGTGSATPLMADNEQEILKMTQTESLEAALAKVAGVQPEDKR